MEKSSWAWKRGACVKRIVSERSFPLWSARSSGFVAVCGCSRGGPKSYEISAMRRRPHTGEFMPPQPLTAEGRLWSVLPCSEPLRFSPRNSRSMQMHQLIIYSQRPPSQRIPLSPTFSHAPTARLDTSLSRHIYLHSG